MQHRELPDGWDKDIPVFPADPKGAAGRDASAKVQNAMAQEHALADRRLGRSGAFHQDAPHVRWRGRFRPRKITAAATCTSASANMPWVRSSTAWRSRRYALTARGFLIFSDYARAADPSGRHHGNSGHLHLHARFHRRRRRRPYASAGGTTDLAAGDSRPDRSPAGRRQRSRRSLAPDHEAAPRAGVSDPVAAEYAHAGPHKIRAGVGRGEGRRTCWPTQRAASPMSF